MNKDDPRNQAASVRQKLLNRSREKGEDFQVILNQYALERFLYRLSRSAYQDRFVLKGAMLFVLWEGALHRITRDLDLLGYGSPDIADLVSIIRDVCATRVQDDGLIFLADEVVGSLIREDQAYEGVRLRIPARLGTARLRLQVDVGFGDAITPQPEEVAFPTLLASPAPVLKAYPRETVIAEKLQAMVALGIANSRMKDFYDVAYLARHFPFDGPLLAEAIQATFQRRGTPLPAQPPLALTDTFATDPSKRIQWHAFLRKVGLEEQDLSNLIGAAYGFLWPPLDATTKGIAFEQTWTPPGPWE